MGATEVKRDKPVSVPHFGLNFLKYTKLNNSAFVAKRDGFLNSNLSAYPKYCEQMM